MNYKDQDFLVKIDLERKPLPMPTGLIFYVDFEYLVYKHLVDIVIDGIEFKIYSGGEQLNFISHPDAPQDYLSFKSFEKELSSEKDIPYFKAIEKFKKLKSLL